MELAYRAEQRKEKTLKQAVRQEKIIRKKEMLVCKKEQPQMDTPTTQTGTIPLSSTKDFSEVCE